MRSSRSDEDLCETGYKPYFDTEFESLIARIHPPRATIDNDSCKDCTLVKVDSANKHGILLEMVQVLTDLDLVISKSYICSDGDWFMDVFHVTDQLGNKITDDRLIDYIQQALCAGRTGARANQWEVQRYCGDRLVQPSHVLSEQYTALEMTTIDRPGLLSEVSAVLVELGCQVVSAVAWTHNTRAACIIYVEDESKGGPITEPHRLAHIEDQLGNVVGAHNGTGEKRRVRLAPPTMGRTHTERRLHQLMYADKDYERCGCGMDSCGEEQRSSGTGIIKKDLLGSISRDNGSTQVSIENCQEKGYSVVNITSRDRPKLLFDTVCALTDMQYVVFHAAISSKGSRAVQEYYIRHKDGCTLDAEDERRRVVQSLVAAVERRVSHGLRLDVCTRDRAGLLSDITRVFREHGLSVTRAEIGIRGERAIGSFYVVEASGKEVDAKTVQMVQNEIEGTGASLMVNKSPVWSPLRSSSTSSSSNHSNSSRADQRPNRSSFGSLLWAQLERLSGIKS